ncbi:MAG: hypothetical protein ACRDMH_17470 [Solirubrobacterales bacterium]
MRVLTCLFYALVSFTLGEIQLLPAALGLGTIPLVVAWGAAGLFLFAAIIFFVMYLLEPMGRGGQA